MSTGGSNMQENTWLEAAGSLYTAHYIEEKTDFSKTIGSSQQNNRDDE